MLSGDRTGKMEIVFSKAIQSPICKRNKPDTQKLRESGGEMKGGRGKRVGGALPRHTQRHVDMQTDWKPTLQKQTEKQN